MEYLYVYKLNKNQLSTMEIFYASKFMKQMKILVPLYNYTMQ